MRRWLLWLPLGLALAVGGGACGKAEPERALQKSTPTPLVVTVHGAVSAATKNTTRLGGSDAGSDAAAVAHAVYPGLTAATRPQAVVLVDERNWPAALAASTLAASPLGAPLLYTHGAELPPAAAGALSAMRPLGAPALGGAQVISIGSEAPLPAGYRVHSVSAARGAAAAAAAVAQLAGVAQARQPRRVIVLASDAPRALQMPAAGLAAESGAPILFIDRSGVPAPTAAVLSSLHRPAIYVVGTPAASAGALAQLARYGRVTKIAGSEGTTGALGARETDPAANAVSVSRFSDGSFGWGIHEAGHGLVFVNSMRSLDAPAVASLSAHGDYAPLLLLNDRAALPTVLARYLSNIEPGYTAAVGPVREVYNHGWLIGDEAAISARVQAELDAILEVAPRTSSTAEPPTPAPE
jgi:hypothetical protein